MSPISFICLVSAAFVLARQEAFAQNSETLLQKQIPVNWISSKELQKLSKKRRALAIESAQIARGLLKKSPQDWNQLKKAMQDPCSAGQDRNPCYQIHKHAQDTRKIVRLDEPSQITLPEEVLPPRPAAPTQTNARPAPQGPKAKNCRVNALIEGIQCHSAAFNKPIISYEEAFDLFCQKKILNPDWLADLNSKLNDYEKCLEQNQKNSKGYEKAWAADSYERVTKVLVPNLRACAQELSEKRDFSTQTTPRGHIIIKAGTVDIVAKQNYTVSQKSYLGASLDGRGYSLCDFEIRNEESGARTPKPTSSGTAH
jgi:hypothetical protein